MHFQKIDNHMEQVVKTSAFLAKVKGKDDNLIKMFEEEYQKDITDIDKVSAMCFYQWFLADSRLDLADTNSVFQVTFDVINKIDETLEKKPECWLLYILKYKIISFMNFNENDLINDIKKLIEEQEDDEMMPYYLITEVLLAHLCYATDRIGESRKILENILKKYVEKINILSEFFKGYVVEFKNLVLRSGDNDILIQLERILTIYFE